MSTIMFLILLCLSTTLVAVKAEDVATSTSLPDLTSPKHSCNASYWLKAKEQFEDYIDILQAPCYDYWEYACGNWRVPHRLRFLKPTDTLTAVKASNKYLLMQHFDEAEQGHAQVEASDLAEKSVVQFYKSCLDNMARRSRAQDELSIRLYTDVLGNFSSYWPILQPKNAATPEKNFNWEHVAGHMRRYGAQALIRTMIQPNWQSSQQLIVYLMPPTFELLKARQSDTSFDEESAFLYQRYVKMLMMDLGLRVRQSNLIANEVINFEKSLLALDDSKYATVLKEPQSLASLSLELPQVDLKKYFQIILQDFTLPEKYEEKLLIVANKEYLRKLVRFLDQSKTDTIGKYFLVQFLVNFEVNLHDDDGYFKQKEKCLMQVNGFMPSELTRIFLRLQYGNGEEFLRDTEEHLQKIFEKLKIQFEKLVNSTSVFERDVYSKNLSIEKIRNMRLLLPKLEKNSSPELLTEMKDNYDLNLITLTKLKNKLQLQQLVPHMVSDIGEINTDPNLSLSSLYLDQTYGPLDVNAYYRLKKNAIELPIGILRPPLYDRCLKPAKIYGGFVYMLAHEILHGFDYDGMNYGKSGNTNNGWGPKAIIKFGVKSNCYLNERYGDGHSTINENIADSEGLRLALETLLDSEVGPSFDQDDLKLFFLSFAQTWCGASGASSSSIRIHASHQERVNNVLGNFMEFADIYKCKPSTPLHPEEKCRIW
ncbi:neprilysin 6 [Haematobia irritans]|uniref:neprilysin 6 n=1 Tax=Haematobia irritans TaxID=7368 RepID=UPI003F50737B